MKLFLNPWVRSLGSIALKNVLGWVGITVQDMNESLRAVGSGGRRIPRSTRSVGVVMKLNIVEKSMLMLAYGERLTHTVESVRFVVAMVL